MNNPSQPPLPPNNSHGKRASKNRYNVTKLPDLLTDLRCPSALDKLQELRSMSVGSRGQQNWIDAVRSTGTLLSCLTEEEYSEVCRAFKDSPLPARKRRAIIPSSPSPGPSSLPKGLF